MEDWKTKIAVLWLIYGVAGLVFSNMMLMEPVVIAQIMAGEIEGTKMGPEISIDRILLLDAILLLAILVMAFLPMTLNDSRNRWTHVIVGIVFAGFGLASPIEYLAKQSAYSAYVILIGIVQVVDTVLIVSYAWKSKQKA